MLKKTTILSLLFISAALHTSYSQQPPNSLFQKGVKRQELTTFYGLNDSQAARYQTAIESLDSCFVQLNKLNPREQIPARRKVNDIFAEEVRSIMDSAQFALWTSHWLEYTKRITPHQVHQRFNMEASKAANAYLLAGKKFEARYQFQDIYIRILANEMGIDLNAARELFMEEIYKSYSDRRVIKAISLDPQSIASVGRVMYESEYNQMQLRQSQHAKFIKDILTLEEELCYRSLLKDVLGETKYRAYVDFQDDAFNRTMLNRNKFSENQLKEYKVIMKQFHIDAYKINNTEELDIDAKKAQLEQAKLLRDEKIRKILTAEQAAKFFKSEEFKHEEDMKEVQDDEIYR